MLSYKMDKLSYPSLLKNCSEGFLLSCFNKAKKTLRPFESLNKNDKYVNWIKFFFLNFFNVFKYRTDIMYMIPSVLKMLNILYIVLLLSGKLFINSFICLQFISFSLSFRFEFLEGCSSINIGGVLYIYNIVLELNLCNNL